MSTPIVSLARRWRLDVNIGTEASPNYQLCPGITEFQPTMPPNIEDSSDYDGNGWMGNVKTGQSWEIAATFNRKINDQTKVYNPVHEFLRLACFAFGSASIVGIRFYDRNGLPEAYSGNCIVTWEPQGGEYTALDQVSITLTGDGILTPITNPAA
jgi:hypothetical protein